MSAPMSVHDRTERDAGYAFILIFAIMAMGIVLIGYLHYLNYEQDYRVEMENELSSIAELKVSELALWRKEWLGDGAVLFNNRAFSALARRFLEKPGDTDAQGKLQDWIGRYLAGYHYARVALFDTQGRIRMSAPHTPGPYVSSVAGHVTEILRSGQVGIEDFHRNTPDGPIHLAVVVPIFDSADGGRPLGVLALNIDPGIYLYSFISRWPTPSQTGETLLVRRDGDDVLFLSELRFQKNTALRLRIPLTKTEVPAVRAALGQTGTFEGVDYRGVPVIAAVRPVPGSPWSLLARMNTSEVYAPMREHLWQMAAFVAVLLFCSGGAMGFIWRQKSARYREREKAAAAILESETRFRQLAEATFEGVIISESGRILDVNKSFLEMAGYGETEEVVGRNALELVAPQYRDLVADRIATGHEKPYEAMATRKDGSTIPIEVCGKTMEIAGRRIRVTAIRDITERKQAEVALKESEQKFRALFEEMVSGFVLNKMVFDEHGQAVDYITIEVNREFERILNATRESVVGKKAYETVPGLDRKWLDIFGKVALTGTPRSYEEYVSHLNKWLEGTVFRPQEGLVAGTFIDITERKRAESELRLAKEQAEGATKLKDKFISLVAHDLRSPFASMMGLLRLFVDRKSLITKEEEQKLLDTVFTSGDRMMTMIDQLLKISRLQTGKITPQPSFFKGYVAVAVTIGSVSHNAAQKGIEIINDVPKDMRLYADQSLFDEVLLNLLSNAIKFCSKGDKIAFFAPPGLRSAIAIRDTGKGIDERNISSIFRQEVTTSTPGTAGELGTGLGLPYSYDIMRAHGGELTVESLPGKGSVFCALLPYVRPVALVVDDDPMALLIARSHLEKIDIEVIEVLDGDKALAALKDTRPHIIITDIIMPGMDGYALLDRLKHDSATSGIPVIVMTSTDGTAREKALRHGADDFVSKPIVVEDFIPRVRRFVG